MEPKKYELTEETKNFFGRTLHRIRALRSFSDVNAGDSGGWIENENNLSHGGDAQVSDDAWVFGNAHVCGNAQVSDDAHVCGNAQVCGDARVFGNAQVSDDAWVFGNAHVCGDAQVSGNAQVSDDALVFGNARVFGNAQVSDDAWVFGNAQVCGNAWVCGNARVCGDARISTMHHYWTSPRIGSRNDITTFYRSKDSRIMVVCGCCHTDIEDFAKRVRETHGDNQHAKDYYEAIKMAKIWIHLDGDENEPSN